MKRGIQALLVAAGICLSLSLGGPARAGDPPATAPSGPALNLTPPQQQKLSALEGASRARADLLIRQIRQTRDRLSGLYGAFSLDVGEARRLNQQLNRLQGQLLDLRLSEQLQLRAILSPDQFAHLQAGIHQHDHDDHEGRDHDDGDRGRDHRD